MRFYRFWSEEIEIETRNRETNPKHADARTLPITSWCSEKGTRETLDRGWVGVVRMKSVVNLGGLGSLHRVIRQRTELGPCLPRHTGEHC